MTTSQYTISGGSGSTEAYFLDMRTTATRLDSCGDDATHLCGAVVAIGLALPRASAILSPGSAVAITTKIGSLTLHLGSLALRMEFVARTLRWSAAAYELTDALRRAAFAAVNIATTPQRLYLDVVASADKALVESRLPQDGPNVGDDLLGYGAAIGRNFVKDFQEQVEDDPALVDGTVAWTSFLVGTAGRTGVTRRLGLGTAPSDFEGQIAWLLANGRSFGWFQDSKPLSVKQTRASKQRARSRQLQDIVAEDARTEHQSTSDHSIVHVRRVVGADGKGAWVVAIPGTTHWNLESDHGPSATAANLATEAGVKSSLYPAIDKAVGAAMKEAGVSPGSEPVMVTGHSQGGIVATRLAVDDHFRTKYHVTEVVTAGSPISRIKVPTSVNVLSLENVHDPVPRADGVANPDTVNRTNIVVETPKGEKLNGLVDAHDASRYARSAAELGPDVDNAQLSEWYARNHRFLDGKDTDFTFQLRRN